MLVGVFRFRRNKILHRTAFTGTTYVRSYVRTKISCFLKISLLSLGHSPRQQEVDTKNSTMRFAAALLLPIAATTAFAPNVVHGRQRMALSAFWDKVSENNA